MQKIYNALFGSKTDLPPLETVPHVDVEKYLGRWYEIATLPSFFQRDSCCTTATYSLNQDGTVKVYNRTLKGGPTGKVSSITGSAWPVDSTNSKLKVQFFYVLRGDYWIIKLDSDYQWAVVTSSKGRDYFWILSRTPKMDEALYNELVEYAKGLGFPVEKLIRTHQGEGCNYDD